MKRNAFSMVELSIVLIIIGLLVAAVSGGTKIIAQAKLRQVLSEISTIRTSAQGFQATYDAYPGDFVIADNFFGSSQCNGGSCNGDGDGVVEWSGETYNSFQHLKLAKLLNYDITESASFLADGYYSFVSKIAETSCYHGLISVVTNANMGSEITTMQSIVSNLATAANSCNDALLTTAQAKFIDSKLDDGAPHTGDVRIRYSYGTVEDTIDCSDTRNDYTESDTYNLSQTGAACNLVFKVM